NAEWQAAVAGTPDPGPDDGRTDCNTLSPVAVPSGSRSACVSSAGAFDMVGNLDEWVADWVPPFETCGQWTDRISATDITCLLGAGESGEPGALVRGGDFLVGPFSGPFTVIPASPSLSVDVIGMRCAR